MEDRSPNRAELQSKAPAAKARVVDHAFGRAEARLYKHTL
jgi:hypothetical protein